MSEELFIKAYKLLDDESKIEEERVDNIEDIVRELLPDLMSDEVERLVLDILMAHHRGASPGDAASAHKAGKAKSSHITNTNPSRTPTKGSTGTSSAIIKSGAPKPILPVLNTLKPFDQLRNLFGWENTDDDIERALSHNDFDVDRTISMLAGEQADLELSKEQVSSRIMCRYFISGNCARGSQCMYSHDSGTRLCRFWLHQRCIATDNQCLFKHEIPQESISRVESMQPTTNTNKDTASAFNDLPSLSALPKLGSKPSNNKKKSPANGLSALSLNEVPRLRPIKEVLGSHRGLVPLTAPRLVPWKALEFANNQKYYDLRKQAAVHAEMRNKLLQQSTAAWSANDAAQAKQLSSRGRDQEQQMIQCYRQAAEIIWDQQSVPNSEVWLDLHGTDLGDAVAELEEKLEALASTRHSPRQLYLITGRGHFKAKKYADQMSQYVTAYLDSKGYKHKDFGVDPAFGRITAIDPWSKIRDVNVHA